MEAAKRDLLRMIEVDKKATIEFGESHLRSLSKLGLTPAEAREKASYWLDSPHDTFITSVKSAGSNEEISTILADFRDYTG